MITFQSSINMKVRKRDKPDPDSLNLNQWNTYLIV